VKRIGLLSATVLLLLTGCLAVPQPSDEPPTGTPTAEPTIEPPGESAAGDLQQIPGVLSVVDGDWPHVTVETADDLPGVQAALTDHPLWQDGGILWVDGGRVRLTELPDSLTAEGYTAIIEASIAYPSAQFWLEAPTTGHGWPQLFVDQVSTEEAAGIQAALAGPFVAASADVSYFIRASTADGPIDTAGVLGTS